MTPSSPYYFEIVHKSTVAEGLYTVAAMSNPNEATVTFHHTVERLRREGCDGDVLLQRCNPGRVTLLRQPLVPRPTGHDAIYRRPS